MRVRLAVLLCVVIVMLGLAIWWTRRNTPPVVTPVAQTAPSQDAAARSPSGATTIFAHNLRLHQGPQFSIYVRWLRGHMDRTRPNVSPSFDDLESFYLDITNGVLRANLGDFSTYLNSANSNSPLKNITVRGDGSQLRITGTLHKVIPLPIELMGTLSVVPTNRILMQVTKINVLKIPFKTILGDLHVKVSDFFKSEQIPGIEVTNNNIVFDPQILMPAPHIRGSLTKVAIKNPDLEAIYGDAREDVQRTEEWRNYLRLSGGALNFGKLTMNPVDLIMIDISQDPWFDLDLSRYQEQLVNGYTRMTPQAGLQIFMPDLTKTTSKADKNINIEWLKNRNVPPPPNVLAK